MTLNQLEYFMKVAEELNFTKAAAKMYISQQGISSQISKLEEEFGFRLFERTTRSVSLTKNGKKLYALLDAHRRDFQELISDAMLASANQQVIKVGILDVSRIVDYVVPAIERLEQSYPHITWEYRTGYFSQLQDEIERRELDMIVTLSTELPSTHPADQILILKDLELTLMISDRHPLADKDHLDIRALEGQTVMTFAPDFSYGAAENVLEDCRQNSIRPAEVKYYSNFNILEMELISGKGIHIGFDMFFRDPQKRIISHPIEVAKGLQKANLVLAWLRPEYRVFAKIAEEKLVWEE